MRNFIKEPILLLSSVFILTLASLVACSETSAKEPPTPVTSDFDPPDDCQQCHPVQHLEWQGSVMHYSALSPVFNAFELTVRELNSGAFSADGEALPNFCIGCHSPISVANGETPGFDPNEEALPQSAFLSDLSLEALSCDFCHTVSGPDLTVAPMLGKLGDGIANAAFLFAPTLFKNGPIPSPTSNNYHGSLDTDRGASNYLTTPEFCGSCHDVRLPVEDKVTGEPFRRLENLFSEWQAGPYNSVDNPFGKVITCQDCHMSLYPLGEPGEYPTIAVSQTPEGEPGPLRKHALHAFTSVSIPFIDDPRLPRVDSEEVDQFGYPLGQQQRRELVLKSALAMSLEDTPTSIAPSATTLPIRITVTNVGAGHNVPSGFSQERQTWIELIVEDDTGLLYESGTLVDSTHPTEPVMDGRVDDEDLRHEHFEICEYDFDTHVSHTDPLHPSPDYNERHSGINLGLVIFTNRFIRIHTFDPSLPECEPEDFCPSDPALKKRSGSDPNRTPENGCNDPEHLDCGPEDAAEERCWEPILNPAGADHMDNSQSLAMLEPRQVLYDIPITRALDGNIQVSARIRYRAFPPEFLRFLAEKQPNIVTEDIIDRNTIVDMVSAETTINLQSSSNATGRPQRAKGEQLK